MLTENPKHLNVERLQEATKQIEGVLEYAIHDKKIAKNMLLIISNMLAINETILENGDQNGTTTDRLVYLIDKFTDQVKLERGESITLETENIFLKAMSWDPNTSDLVDDILSFSVHYQARQRREYLPKSKYRQANHHNTWNEVIEEETFSVYNDAELSIPVEALLLAQNQSYQELRIKFVAYRNDKFFRSRSSGRRYGCNNRRFWRSHGCKSGNEQMGFPGRRVLQASISNVSVTNLSDPVVYTMPSPLHVQLLCVYWKEHERIWSTEGIITNQSGNYTTCMSSHLTAFSLLLDPTPGEGISYEHQYALSVISYIGSGLSMLGLTLTIITYSLFRCLNRDHPGKILLNLCVSMLLMNTVFVLGSQRGAVLAGIDVCVTVAVLIHYFLLTTLAWMCVEAINMYQLLIHVFASSESHFMLKRSILAWGIPLVIVGVTVLMDWSVYHNQNEFCMLSAANPYVYYISFLGPSCLILLINLTVFIMVTRVLFTPRSVSKPAPARNKKEKFTVTTAQVRGAFSVMVLLGVSWVFGAFAFGEARLIFQYVFCVANSLQGFLIFIVRCLQYPEARSAWYQLLKTGTLKKYRGMQPPGSWSGNSNSSHKQNGHSTTSSRLGSTDATNNAMFNSNFWNKSPPKEGSGTQYPNQMDFTASRSAQLLTFSAGLKSNSIVSTTISTKDDNPLKRLSKNESISRSPSESSQTSDKPIENDPCSHLTFGIGSPGKVDAVDSEENLKPVRLGDDCSADTQISSVPSHTEPRYRGSFGSIGFIDDEAEHLRHSHHEKSGGASTLERKIFAAKAPSSFGHPKNHSPPELDKQHSWPRTLSSFLGGKEPVKGSSECGGQNSLPKRFFTAGGNGCGHSLNECQDRHSCQIIPLQVRPSTPSSHYTFSPTRRDPTEKRDCEITPKTAFGTFSHSGMQSMAAKTGEVTPTSHPVTRFYPAGGSTPGAPHTPRTPSLDVISDVSISGPATHVFVPHNGDNKSTPKQNASSEDDNLPDQDTFKIWEKQGLVSPSKAMFIDSAASRL